MDLYTVLADYDTLTAGAASVVYKWQVPMAKGGIIYLTLKNGATAPDKPAKASVSFGAEDNFQKSVKFGGDIVGSEENEGTESLPIPVPENVQFVFIEAGDNTVQDVTIRLVCVPNFTNKGYTKGG